MLNLMSKKIVIVLVFTAISIAFYSCCAKKKNNIQNSSTLLRVCPEEWIQNKMPSTNSTEPNEYFILDGKRKELKEFDLEWIKSNCTIKPTIVQ